MRSWRPQDTKTLEKITAALVGWAKDIDKLVNPPWKLHIAAACPACGATTVKRTDSGGERVNLPALQIDPDAGCTCQECRHTWTPDLYLHLCRVLGFRVPAGVLE